MHNLFYTTYFDSIAYTVVYYNYKSLGENEKPHAMSALLWCVLLIVLPMALVFSESSMNNIRSVSIISAFLIGIMMILRMWSCLKDAKRYREEKGMVMCYAEPSGLRCVWFLGTEMSLLTSHPHVNTPLSAYGSGGFYKDGAVGVEGTYL